MDRGRESRVPQRPEVPRRESDAGRVEEPEDDVARLEAADGQYVPVHGPGVVATAVEVLGVPPVQVDDVRRPVGLGVGVGEADGGGVQVLLEEEVDLVGRRSLGEGYDGPVRRRGRSERDRRCAWLGADILIYFAMGSRVEKRQQKRFARDAA